MFWFYFEHLIIIFSPFISKGSITTNTILSLHTIPNDIKNKPNLISSSHFIHIGIILVWISTLAFHGTYFTRFSSWSLKSDIPLGSGSLVLHSFGQDFLNIFDDGQYMVAGLFFFWRSIGILNQLGLKSLALLSFLLSLFSFILTHLSNNNINTPGLSWFDLNFCWLAGFGSLSWSGHIFHTFFSYNNTPLVFKSVWFVHDGGINLSLILFQHIAIGISLLFLGNLNLYLNFNLNGNFLLSLSLGLLGSISIAFSFIISFISPYGGLQSSYSTLWSLYCHHYWIGILFLVGSGSHMSLYSITTNNSLFRSILSQRELILVHLTWVLTFLGVHSVGILMHNDSMEALNRYYDCFSDTSIQLRPFISTTNNMNSPSFVHINLRTADFIVFHVETFCIHTTVFILLKGFFMAQSSRILPDKKTLGFLFPCDGPGRGGTCQIGPFDHVFLASFWAYNTGAVGIFHWFWFSQYIKHIIDDWFFSALSIGGWLKSLLWAQSAQILQSYSTPLSSFSFIFLTGHFIWALSLMFLFSGRGYWQDLIESILWVHLKLNLIPSIQPRALSISTGRAVGLLHFILGGISVTWAFTLSRIL